MGIVAGAGAAIAAASAISTIATVGFVTLTSALEIAAAVGGVLSVIGTVTGNKDLAMAGMALGIVGGVGALASGAGLFGDAANSSSLFGGGADAAAGGASDVATTSAAGTDVGDSTISSITDPGTQVANAATAGATPDGAAAAAAEATPGGTSTDIINSIGQTNPNAVLPATAEQAQTAQAAGNAGDIVTGGDQSSPLASAVNEPNATPPSAAGVPQGAGGVPSIPGVTAPAAPGVSGLDPVTGLPETAADIPGMKPPIPGGAFDASVAGNDNGNILTNLAGFAKSNPIATYGLIQAAGSFAQGAFSPVTPAQVNALNAQAAANNAAASLTNTQQSNIQSGVPGATVNQPVQSAPVTGKPQGLINTQAAA